MKISDNRCFECGTDENIVFHHVVPISLEGTRTVPLCEYHHGLVHSKKLTNMITLSLQKKKELIDEKKHLILTAPHPSPLSAYNGFFGCKHFSKANKFLEENIKSDQKTAEEELSESEKNSNKQQSKQKAQKAQQNAAKQMRQLSKKMQQQMMPAYVRGAAHTQIEEIPWIR